MLLGQHVILFRRHRYYGMGTLISLPFLIVAAQLALMDGHGVSGAIYIGIGSCA